jgi:hypothetical protein
LNCNTEKVTGPRNEANNFKDGDEEKRREREES